VNSPKQSIKLFWIIARQNGSAVQRSINIFLALKSYFLSTEKCPVNCKHFFQNPFPFTFLHFLASQLKTFPRTIKCIEKQDTIIIEVNNEISKLLDNLNCRKTERFLTTAVRDKLQVKGKVVPMLN
jgi:hypothetical protein